MALVELKSIHGVRLAHRGPTLVCCFLGWPNAVSLKAMADAQAEVARDFGRVSVLAIIPEIDVAMLKAQGSAALEQSDRAGSVKESASTGEKLQDTTIASAIVILPRGLVAVMIRSFVGALSLVSRSRTPTKTFKELAPAIAWLEAQPGASQSIGLLRDVEEWVKEGVVRVVAS